MKIAVLCQEEPVFLGPFLRGVLAARPGDVVAVCVAGRRSAGERRRTLRQRLEALRIFWLLFEPAGFAKALLLRLRARLLGARDPHSVAGLARRLGIPLHRVGNPNDAAFHRLLRDIGPDAVLNQSELLLKPEVLSIPRHGFLNRHASLLPDYRGRLASFWSHAAEPPAYGVTIHRVDAGIDTGDILLQREFPEVDPRWAYPKVMDHLCGAAPRLFWEAVDALEAGGEPTGQPPPEGDTCRFPDVEAVKRYRAVLAQRRALAEPPL